MTVVKSAKPKNPNDELEHVTQEMYKKNLELAETNQTLTLLRKIDEIVLDAEADIGVVSDNAVKAITTQADFFELALLLVVNRKSSLLEVRAFSSQNSKIKLPGILGKSINRLPELVRKSIRRQKVIEGSDLKKLLPGEIITQIEQAKIDSKLHYFICSLDARGELKGILVLATRIQSSKISKYQRQLVERLTRAIGIAIDSKLLYAEIQEATARLKITNRHLKELDKAKDEFISMASHQLRTPLTAIKGYVSMLNDGDAGKLNEQQANFADLAFTSAQRMVSLISDMLNVSRISTGKLVIEKAPFDFDKITQEEINLLITTAKAKGVELVYHRPKNKIPMLQLDEGKMRQVIMNFTDNAIYYAPNTTIDIYVERNANRVEFKVIDRGIGVPDKEKKELFTKFFRAGNARNVRPDGTGLGLFMAKMVVEMQGGKIIFESQEGEGSTFGCSFPVKIK